MIKKIKSTIDEFVESLSAKERKKFEEEYRELLLSEMILAAMQQDEISVRKLAKLAGVSPTIIQGIRSGTRKNVSVQSFLKILQGLGCNRLIIERNGELISFNLLRCNSSKLAS